MESLNKANNGAAAPSEGDVDVIDELRTTYNLSLIHISEPTRRS